MYQTPCVVPTPGDDSADAARQPQPSRYSYGGSKIVTELIAFNYAQEHYRKVQVFRPHNVFGPDMGWKHVEPQFIVRALDAAPRTATATPRSTIQGDGTETRSFCYVDDVVQGILTMYADGGHREVYHIGSDVEI